MLQNILIITSMSLALIGCLFLLLTPNSKQKKQKRIKFITTHSNPSQTKASEQFLKNHSKSQRQQIKNILIGIDKQAQTEKKKQNNLNVKLNQVNWPITETHFILICIGLGGVGAIIAFFFKFNLLMSSGVIIFSGFVLPNQMMNMLIKRRQKLFIEHFAEAMDVIVRGVRTGLPLNECLRIIAREAQEPVASEFIRLTEAERLGVPIEVSLNQLHQRMPLAEVGFFITALNIQRTTGGNLGETLNNLSKVIRGRKMLREKVKALSAEAKASAYVVGGVPFVVGGMVSVLAWDYMHTLFTTQTGQRNLMISAGLMVVGILVLRKMVNFNP